MNATNEKSTTSPGAGAYGSLVASVPSAGGKNTALDGAGFKLGVLLASTCASGELSTRRRREARLPIRPEAAEDKDTVLNGDAT